MKPRAFKDRLKGHRDVILELNSPYGSETGVLYSISKDGVIRIWDLFERKITNKLILSKGEAKQDSEEERKHINKDNEIQCALFQQNCVYGGYRDGKVFLWNLNDGQILNEFQAHDGKVLAIKRLDQRVFITSGKDKYLNFWDSMTGEKENSFKFEGKIDILKVIEQKIYLLVDKTQFYQLDPKLNECTIKCDMNTAFYTDFIVYNNRLFIADCDRNLKIYDLQNLMVPQKVINVGTWILSMNNDQNYLFAGTDNHMIRLYDINNYDLLDDVSGHEDGVCKLEFAGGMLYSASFDQTIRSWDIQEMKSRIYEKKVMFFEDIRSKKWEAYLKVLPRKKKKKKKGKKKRK